MKQIVILGAGISGLALGWFLKQRFGNAINLTFLENSSRIGGWIQTIEKEGFLFELGPHSCRPFGTHHCTLPLIADLGLSEKIITAGTAAQKRYLYLNKELTLLPYNASSFLRSSLKLPLLYGAMRDLIASRGSGEDESIYSFIGRRFGTKIAETLVDPLTTGIYAGDIRQLSIRSCFSTLYRYEQEYGSVIRGMFANKEEGKKQEIFSFQEGMETLIHALGSHLKPSIQFSCYAKELSFSRDGIEVATSNGSLLHADFLFSAIPAPAFAELLTAHDPALAELLKSIQSVSIATVNFGFHKQVLKSSGFGYLIPSSENEEVLGMIWDSCIFPEQNGHSSDTRLTVMIGGAKMASIFNSLDKEDFLQIALRALEEQLQIKDTPAVAHLSIARSAIPQYTVGHADRIRKIEQKTAQLSSKTFFLGNSYYGVSINDCIAEAKRLAYRIDDGPW